MQERYIYRPFVTEKQCRLCLEVKSREEFWVNPKNIDGLVSYCKDCNGKRTRAWHREHPEAQQEYNRKITKARKAEEEKGDLSKYVTGGKQNQAICEYCGSSFTYMQRRKPRIYCSMKCRNKSSRERVCSRTQERDLVSV